MPLADHTSLIPGSVERFRERDGIGVELYVVEENSVGQRTLAGQQRSTRGRTDRKSGDGVDEASAFSGKAVEVRRAHVRIAGEAERLRAPLVSENDEDVGFRV